MNLKTSQLLAIRAHRRYVLRTIRYLDAPKIQCVKQSITQRIKELMRSTKKAKFVYLNDYTDYKLLEAVNIGNTQKSHKKDLHSQRSNHQIPVTLIGKFQHSHIQPQRLSISSHSINHKFLKFLYISRNQDLRELLIELQSYEIQNNIWGDQDIEYLTKQIQRYQKLEKLELKMLFETETITDRSILGLLNTISRFKQLKFLNFEMINLTNITDLMIESLLNTISMLEELFNFTFHLGWKERNLTNKLGKLLGQIFVHCHNLQLCELSLYKIKQEEFDQIASQIVYASKLKEFHWILPGVNKNFDLWKLNKSLSLKKDFVSLNFQFPYRIQDLKSLFTCLSKQEKLKYLGLNLKNFKAIKLQCPFDEIISRLQQIETLIFKIFPSKENKEQNQLTFQLSKAIPNMIMLRKLRLSFIYCSFQQEGLLQIIQGVKKFTQLTYITLEFGYGNLGCNDERFEDLIKNLSLLKKIESIQLLFIFSASRFTSISIGSLCSYLPRINRLNYFGLQLQDEAGYLQFKSEDFQKLSQALMECQILKYFQLSIAGVEIRTQDIKCFFDDVQFDHDLYLC